MEIVNNNEATLNSKTYNIKSLLRLVKTLPDVHCLGIVEHKNTIKHVNMATKQEEVKEIRYLELDYVTVLQPAVDTEFGKKYTGVRDIVYQTLKTCALKDNKLEDPEELTKWIIIKNLNIPTLLDGRDIKEYIGFGKNVTNIDVIYKNKQKG